MKDYGLVSIITPCYNAALVISKTIESVIAQTYSNWELLVVDDCSTDNTLQVVEEYIAKDVRVKLLKTNKASGSPAEPRNIGIKNARGVFLAFVDSDDVWLPNKLTQTMKRYHGMGLETIVFLEFVKSQHIVTHSHVVKYLVLQCCLKEN